MSILFTVSYYTPYVSGLTIYVERLTRALAERKNKITVLTTQYQKTLPQQEITDKVYIKRVPFLFRISKGFFMPKYIEIAFGYVRQSSTVLSLPQFEAFIVAIIARLFGKKLICIYHCEVDLPPGFLNTIVEYVLHASHCITLLFSYIIITYTKDFAKHSKVLRFFSKKILYIYPPIPVPVIDKKIQQDFKIKIPKKTTRVIGIAARVAAEKGIEYLLEAIPLLRQKLGNNFIILFAGPQNPVGEERYLKEISPILKKYKNHILFLGIIPQEGMGAFYSLLHVLVLPSINSTEAFGMVQVEAMLCGTPVVASNLPGVRIPIQETGMGKLVPIKNSQKLADAIVEVIKNKKMYIKKKSEIKKTFSFNDTIDFYEKILRGVS